jgi:hypothetical protein
VSHTLGSLAAIALGLQAGALLAEALVLVPSWRALEATDFLRWYERNGPLLLRFFGPLEVAATGFVLLAAASSFFTNHPGRLAMALASLLALAVLLSFPIYFRSANESFAKATIPAAQVSAELRRWAAWHWARTGLAIAAFVSALVAVGGFW